VIDVGTVIDEEVNDWFMVFERRGIESVVLIAIHLFEEIWLPSLALSIDVSIALVQQFQDFDVAIH
jgi:hypothetical protein